MLIATVLALAAFAAPSTASASSLEMELFLADVYAGVELDASDGASGDVSWSDDYATATVSWSE